jgi:hypothetical protein
MYGGVCTCLCTMHYVCCLLMEHDAHSKAAYHHHTFIMSINHAFATCVTPSLIRDHRTYRREEWHTRHTDTQTYMSLFLKKNGETCEVPTRSQPLFSFGAGKEGRLASQNAMQPTLPYILVQFTDVNRRNSPCTSAVVLHISAYRLLARLLTETAATDRHAANPSRRLPNDPSPPRCNRNQVPQAHTKPRTEPCSWWARG